MPSGILFLFNNQPGNTILHLVAYFCDEYSRMKNYSALFLAFILISLPVFIVAQKKSTIQVERTDVQRYDASLGKNKERLIGGVIFRQEGTRFFCDSAHLNRKMNNFEAFGNVHIVVNDTLDIYGERLYYEGNSRIAELFDSVRLVDKNTVLTTEHMVYNRDTKVAYYDLGGKIVNKDNTLISKKGYYTTSTKIFYFREDVVLTNPDSETYSDTLIYNTNTEVAYFRGPTVIRGEESIIYTEDGWYDTRNDLSKLLKRPSINNSEQTITADSLIYNNLTYYGQAYGHVEISDTVHDVLIKGMYGEMWDNRGVSYITDSAVAITYDRYDSLYIHSDTMWVYFDKEKNAKRLLSYYNVKFFRDDMQGMCDSLVYTMNDSTIRLYELPVLWSGENQLTADSIAIVIHNNQADSLIMYNSSFIISHDTLDTYNQIKGKNMIGYFKNNELVTVNVDGNAQTVYFVREEDGYLIGVNLAESSTMTIRLKDNKLNTINYKTQAKEIMYPESELPASDKELKGFTWRNNSRPRKVMDIFNKE
jgi:lipopolysaccharide export system protein LptA